MDKTMQSMIENLHKNTGKNLEEWVALVKGENLPRHGDVIRFLKEGYGMTHGYANLVAHTARQSDAASAESPNSLIEQQYKGKEHFRPLYERLLQDIRRIGPDFEVAPKNAYVSLRRKKQFAMLQPATKTRFEVGLNLKGQAPQGKLLAVTASNAMCSHKVCLSGLEDLDDEVLHWVRLAFDQAG